jgi:hypothetical protein
MSPPDYERRTVLAAWVGADPRGSVSDFAAIPSAAYVQTLEGVRARLLSREAPTAEQMVQAADAMFTDLARANAPDVVVSQRWEQCAAALLEVKKLVTTKDRDRPLVPWL